MTDRAKLHLVPVLGLLFIFGSVAGLLFAGCHRAPAERVSGVYAHDSRKLLRLDHDYNGDGRIDVRTYMRDGRPVRLEGDANSDGLIDRWEYFGPDGQLLRVGASTQADGVEDTWARSEGARRIVDTSTARDGRVDRREVYEGDVLIRAESDSNHDGLADRWEEFRAGVLVRVLLDDGQRTGRPTRRIVYDGQQTARVETDSDGDGTWEAHGAAR